MKLNDQFSGAFMKAAGVADNAAVRIQRDMDKATGSSNKFKYSLNDLKAKLDSINATRMSTHVESVFNRATKEARKLEAQIDKIEGKVKSGGSVGLGGLISSAALLYGGNDVIKTGIQQESIARAVNFTTQGQGNAAMGFIKNQSSDLGLDESAMQLGFKTLSGGLRGLNFDLKQQQDIMSGVNKGIATFGLQAEGSKRVYLALGQIASKGTVQAEELRGQIGEVIPGAFSIAAKSMGVTEQQLNKLMDKGELMSKDFLPRFAMQMEKEFGQSAIDASSGAAANMNRFSNTMLSVKTVLAKELLPPFITLMGWIRTGIEWIAEHKNFVIPLVAGIASVILVTQGWALAQSVVNTVMKANPIILVIGLIIALVVWIYEIMKANKNWGVSLKAIWEITKSVFALMAIPVKMFWEDLTYWFTKAWYTIQDWGERVWQFMKNLWAGVKAFFTDGWSAAKAAVNQTIHTEAEVKIAALEKEHGAKNKQYGNEFIAEIKSIASNYNKIDFSIAKGKGSTNPLTSNGVSTQGANLSAGLSTTAKDKADNVNSGGQRSIVININKQVGAENIHVMNGAEAANNIEVLVREAMRRMLLSLNGKTVANA